MRRFMDRYWYIWVLITIIAVLGALAARLQWAGSTPARPKTLPATAIWVRTPPTPLEFSPQGDWLACWLNKARNSDYCRVTDYRGKLEFEGDFSPISGLNPVPDSDLRLKNGTGDLWAWSDQDKRSVPVAYLQDGTILVPTRNLAELRRLYFSTGKP